MRIEETKHIGGRVVIDAAELDAINKANPTAGFTLEDVANKRLLAAEAVLIDSRPTRNGNEYPAQWQESMTSKWVGTKLVYSADDHRPNAPDHVGWLYAASIERDGDVTRTIARIAVPVITDTTRLVERLRSGLNHALSIAVDVEGATCKECHQPIKSERCSTHPSAVRVIRGNAEPLHVALVGDPGCASAGIRATSESLRIVESRDDLLLIEDAKRIRTPIISEAVKYAKLNNLSAEASRFERWSLAEIEMYRDSQKEAYIRNNPKYAEQQSFGGDTEPIRESAPEQKELDEVLKSLRS